MRQIRKKLANNIKMKIDGDDRTYYLIPRDFKAHYLARGGKSEEPLALLRNIVENEGVLKVRGAKFSMECLKEPADPAQNSSFI